MLNQLQDKNSKKVKKAIIFSYFIGIRLTRDENLERFRFFKGKVGILSIFFTPFPIQEGIADNNLIGDTRVEVKGNIVTTFQFNMESARKK